MKKKNPARFNLVEIILAMGVIALGMTAVMALLPPALNANRDAMGDAVAEEVASKMVTYMDFVADTCVNTTAGDPAWKSAMESRFPATSCPSLSSADESLDEDKRQPMPIDDFYSDGSGKFTYAQTVAGEKVPAANVLIWRTALPDVCNYGTGGTERPGYRLYFKVCWPATAAATASTRQERIFVYEILRPIQR